MLLVNIFDSVNKKGEENCVLSFQNTVLCHKEAINYCEQKGYYDKYINTVFLMIFNMKYTHLGYLQGGTIW